MSQHFSFSFTYISSFYPIKPSLSSAQYVSACGSTMTFRAQDVISRERLPQMCDNTDTVRSAPIFRKFLNSAGLDNVDEIFLYHSSPVSIYCKTSLLSCHHLTLRTQFLRLMNATLKMWGPVIIIIVIEHKVKDYRRVRKWLLGIFCQKCV